MWVCLCAGATVCWCVCGMVVYGGLFARTLFWDMLAGVDVCAGVTVSCGANVKITVKCNDACRKACCRTCEI